MRSSLSQETESKLHYCDNKGRSMLQTKKGEAVRVAPVDATGRLP